MERGMLQLCEGRQGSSELLREHGIDITGRMLQTALDSGERRAIAQNKCRPCHAAAGFLGQKDKRPRGWWQPGAGGGSQAR